jgi:dolichyl-phosphate beta-glucosyltransferase
MLAASGQYRYMCDADLSVAPDVIPGFISYMISNNADIAYGDRELGRRSNEHWTTHLRGRVFNGLVQAAALPGVLDSQCGFKLFGAVAAKRLFRLPLIVPGWAGDVEVMYLARRAGMRLVAVPVDWRHDQRSHVRHGDSLKMLKDIVRIRINDIQGNYTQKIIESHG